MARRVSRWFRYYEEALDDPKVQSLSGDLFKIWVNLLCAASRYDGSLVEADLPFILRVDARRMSAALDELSGRGLIDRANGVASPHNWNARQFKSDVSTDRVKRFRNGGCNVSSTVSATADVTAPDTETETDTETDTETEAEYPSQEEVIDRVTGEVIPLKRGGDAC